jgi:predicted acetyltransferase
MNWTRRSRHGIINQMAIQLRWVGEADYDRVALARMRAFSTADKELEKMGERLRADPRQKPGDFLLAEMDGEPVGTATSISQKMWIRGACFASQGVAWVGAVKTMRRRGGDASAGVASTVMREIVRKARERDEVVTALMPFRVSFYEHFGYGLVERRNDWTVPMGILPTGDFTGVRFYRDDDFAARNELVNRVNRMGQCDVQRIDAYWKMQASQIEDGMQLIDRPAANGPALGAMFFTQQNVNGRSVVRVTEMFYEDLAAFKRQLHFLASLRDQYAVVQVQLPRDVPLNLLLKEAHVPGANITHPTADVRPMSRMMMRVLDHKKFLESLHLPGDVKGVTTVAVCECEGGVSKFRLEIETGRATVKPSDSTADFECPDRIWAAVACGDLTATDAIRWGVATGGDAAGILDVLSCGPAPFCVDFF